MRRLKLKLTDGNVYTVQTLTRMQVRAIRAEERIRRNSKDAKRLEELNKKMDKEGLSIEEMDEYNELDEKELDTAINIVRMSLSVEHKEFRIDEKDDDKKREEIDKKLDELLDMRDIARIAQFAVTGSLQKEEESIAKDEDIDLTR